VTILYTLTSLVWPKVKNGVVTY